MKILFVSSCQGDGEPKVVVGHQLESLRKRGLNVSCFCVAGRGVSGYLRSVPSLRREIRRVKPDVIHAHYSFSGFLASLSGASPLVVSLMGSDAATGLFKKMVTRFFAKFLWHKVIVKSSAMVRNLGAGNFLVIPNGVDLDLFSPMDKGVSAGISGLDLNRRNIIFAACPGRPEKNFALAEKAVALLHDSTVSLVTVYGKPALEMASYYNSADVLLLTSLWEGSPNVVKEAMACNLPVVATDVGDVDHLLEGVENCHVTSSDPEEIAVALKRALNHGRKSDGREKVISLGLDAASIAERIEGVYSDIIQSGEGTTFLK